MKSIISPDFFKKLHETVTSTPINDFEDKPGSGIPDTFTPQQVDELIKQQTQIQREMYHDK